MHTPIEICFLPPRQMNGELHTLASYPHASIRKPFAFCCTWQRL